MHSATYIHCGGCADVKVCLSLQPFQAQVYCKYTSRCTYYCLAKSICNKFLLTHSDINGSDAHVHGLSSLATHDGAGDLVVTRLGVGQLVVGGGNTGHRATVARAERNKIMFSYRLCRQT